MENPEEAGAIAALRRIADEREVARDAEFRRAESEKHRADTLERKYEEALNRIVALEVELGEKGPFADRYEFLRRQKENLVHCFASEGETWGLMDYVLGLSGEELDAALDKARDLQSIANKGGRSEENDV